MRLIIWVSIINYTYVIWIILLPGEQDGVGRQEFNRPIDIRANWQNASFKPSPDLPGTEWPGETELGITNQGDSGDAERLPCR